MNPIFYKFINYEHFKSCLDDSNLIMCKRNFISPYWEYFGLLSPEGHLEAACVIQKQNSNKLFIKLFEVSEKNYRQGLGTALFKHIVDWYGEKYYTFSFELESLDDESDKFWLKLGFIPYPNEEGEVLYKKYYIN